MLKDTDVLDIFYEGVELRVDYSEPVDDTKGLYDPEGNEITIFARNTISTEDLEMTVLHEFVHARGALRGEDTLEEGIVEQEAEDTMYHNYDAMLLIYSLYNEELKCIMN